MVRFSGLAVRQQINPQGQLAHGQIRDPPSSSTDPQVRSSAVRQREAIAILGP
ncbi:MAG: hypothetical protein H7338_07525 [Candidatus Sericytochromatia bacterium]|nr:hypothetical protein [Candidatus Sericytochromatia bacterium]